MKNLRCIRGPARESFLIDRRSGRRNALSMSLREIRNHLEGGFRPFSIFLSDGRKYDIPHPEFIMIGRMSIAVLAADGDIDTLNPLHIVSVKDLKAPRRRNGQG